MEVLLIHAGAAERHTLGNLLQLYLYDFSEFDGSQVGKDGRFRYPYLASYWQEEDRYPFLIQLGDRLAGFVLVKKGSEHANDEESMDVAEFFVLRPLRRRGIGRAAFMELVRLFPGPWIVRVLDGLTNTTAFWEQVIAEFAEGSIERSSSLDGDRSWTIFRFHVAPPSGVSMD